MSGTPATSRPLLAEGARFLVIGLLATLTYVAASLIASAAGASPYGANLAGYLASVAISYFGHATFTFRSTAPHHVQGPKFITLSLTTYALTNVIVYAVTSVWNGGSITAALAVAITVPPLTWVLSRLWVFRAR